MVLLEDYLSYAKHSEGFNKILIVSEMRSNVWIVYNMRSKLLMTACISMGNVSRI